MKDLNELQRFIKIGDNRINVEEIVSYGIETDWDDEENRYIYVQTRTSDEHYRYYESDSVLAEKLAELDKLLLIN